MASFGDDSDEHFRGALKGRDRARRKAAQASEPLRQARNDLLPHLKLVQREITDLRPANRRVRRTTKAHKTEILSSLRVFGVCRPILIDGENRVIDGHAILAVAMEEKLSCLPCIVVSHLTDDQLRLLTITLNRLQEKGEWDLKALTIEFEELILLDQPIQISGFNEAQIDQILIGDEEEEEAERGPLAPEKGAAPVSRQGDLWVLEDHRIYCGDSTDGRSFQHLLGSTAVRLVLTDCPYNVRIKGHVSGGRHREFVQASGEMSDEDFYVFTLSWMQVASAVLISGGVLASFIDWRSVGMLLRVGEELGLDLLNFAVWHKTNAGMGSFLRSQHELIPIFKEPSGPHVNNVELGRHGRHRSNVWVAPGASSLGSDSRRGLESHPTVKPVRLLRDFILDVTHRGDVVLDPFLGSGSTLMATQATRRRAYGIELDPLYVDVAVRRWQNATRLEARLAETGETFAAVWERRSQECEPGRRALPAPRLRLQCPSAGRSANVR